MTTTAAATNVGAGTTIDVLLDSWDLALRAANKSPATVVVYLGSGHQFADFLAATGMPTDVARIGREHIELWMVELAKTRKPTTVSVRYRSLQSFFKWMLVEREITVNPMANMKPPFVPETRTEVPPDDDLRKLLKACSGKSFEQTRDLALLYFLIDTGCRAGEVIGLQVGDVDLKSSPILAHVTGKGRRHRTVALSHKAAAAMDRYNRARARHPNAKLTALWIGSKGALTGSGLGQLFERRCDQAGITRIHPHQLRHHFADSWLSQGGNEGDLMALAGWRSRTMLARYGAANAAARAALAHAQFSPADKL